MVKGGMQIAWTPTTNLIGGVGWRWRWVTAAALGDGGSVGNALHSLDWMSRSSLGPLARTHVANSLASVNCTE